MTRLTLLIVIVLAALADRATAQHHVEARGLTPSVKLEETIYGHLTELNGKYKMRATEVTFAPGAFLGAHHHVGPGIRFVLSGELAFTEGGYTTIYRAGDYFFETGNLAHTAENKTAQPLRVLFFEILPKDWDGPTIVPPRS
ncbi:MAG: cupin domain-containing protein [Xanthobacteraceae bacterium]|nr:cupin domain-containing protein [Xanthobacteraceae bacterium]